jgi:hypothetical protein
MRRRALSACLGLLLLGAPLALWSGAASGRPGTGPRETVNQRFTAERPGAPTGLSFVGRFHAAGDQQGRPPFLRRMVAHPPRGMRYDTGVPARCTASDAELQTLGPAACPPESRIGHGTAEGLILVPGAHDLVFDHFKHPVDILNNKDQQIVLVESEGSTVVRGRFRRDGAISYQLPTCFPHPPTGGCLDEYVVQLVTSSVLPVYKRRVNGRVRSYATTPPSCPARGYWKTVVSLRWSDGTADKVATAQPCTGS